jgi:hypothetical protein
VLDAEIALPGSCCIINSCCSNLDYRAVVLMQVVLSTHAIKALSLFDIVMAAKIDALPVQYSPKWEREHAAKMAQSQPAAAAASMSS